MRIGPSHSEPQRGFTKIELSVVLLVLGLIIAAVLTTQEIVQNRHITKALAAIQDYQTQFQIYQQKNGALPGDDRMAANRFKGFNLTNGNGNGVIDGPFDAAQPSDESQMLWADLRAAGLVKSQETASAQPRNPFHGIYGFQNGAFKGAITTTVLCLSNVPGTAAQLIDTRLDDGTSNSGAVQAMVSNGTVGEAINGAVSTSGYSSAQTYILCIRM